MVSVTSSAPQAHVIRDDREAIAIAQALADEFRQGDSERDQQRRLPVEGY